MININRLKVSSSKLFLLAILPAVGLLASCAATSEQEAEELSLQELNEAVKEWDTLEPDVKRIIAMEKEITELKGLLIKLTDKPAIAPPPQSKPLKNTVTVVKKEIPVVKKEILVAKKKTPVPNANLKAKVDAKVKPENINDWSVQIGAFSSLADIKLASNSFYKKFSNLQTTTSAYTELVTTSGKPFFRLKIGPFNSFKLANQQCIQAKQLKIDCLPSKLSSVGILVK